MHRSLSLRTAVCLSALLPSTFSFAASEAEVDALKQELIELKQRYEAQQKALMVLEQRVRQVEEQPAAAQPAQPKRLVTSTNKPTPPGTSSNVSTGASYGESLKDDSQPPKSVDDLYSEANGFFGNGTWSFETGITYTHRKRADR